MRARLLGTIAIAAITLTACGGDDDGGGGAGGGGGGGSPQDQVADMMIDVLNEAAEIDGIEGIEIDEGCIRDKVGELSDADARAILDAGPEGDPDVSDEAELIGESMFDCIDLGFDLGEIGEIDGDG
jgi:hypothetical protein